MQKMLALVLFSLALPAHAADNGWASLWRNADQRGEILLQAGDAAAAAKVFADPRRKAHAELMAGDYAKAARDLAAFDDGESHYNRGNALAHAGDLQGALRAYDAALQREPQNQDARHNRDLVANALKQKPPPPAQGSSAQPKQDGKSGGQGGNDPASSSPSQGSQGSQGKQNDASRPGANGKGEEQGRSSAPAPGQAGPTGKQPGVAQAAGAASAQQDGRPQAGAAAPPGRDSAGEARRDAAASLAGAAAGPQNGMGKDGGSGAGGVQPGAPFNEQRLAQEQWLRSIPDDPGGLLRRKFLIEHLMRQQKTQQKTQP